MNDHDEMVREALDGVVISSAGGLARLDGYPDVKVVLRADWSADRVAIVSGGGAGHEPTHAGFVGPGLLTAAVSGEVFASPSADAVLAAIMAVTGAPGCLLVVKNYTGDRLNFGLAMERARALGKQVEMVIVGDDISLPESVRPRGLAGTLFVHKIAGAAAEQGHPLPVVAEQARRVADTVRTIGVSLSGASVPGRVSESRIAEGQAELGLGIHGEPGVETVPVGQARHIISRMTHDLAARLPADERLALLVNNLGGVAALEMGVILRDLLESELGSRCDLVFGPAAVMTAMDMRGFSLSALPIDAGLVEGLLAPVGPLTAWPPARRVGSLVIKPLPAMPAVADVPASDNPEVSRLIEAICRALIAAEADLNALDALVGDGDTGSTFATAAVRIRASVANLALNSTPDLFSQLSAILGTSMGGSSGVLGSIFFAAAATSLHGGASLAGALRDGLESLKDLGGAGAGDRTMIDALEPAIMAMQAGATMDVVAAAAVGGAESTATMTAAKAGRSSYIAAHHLLGVRDPGAAAIALVFRAVGSS